ncbi:MAG: RIP metalloprotease RseP [Lachnospiraceae bacterium]|nr:RIP metalloprotease RseP [Lachnospiraceae bacterium]MBO5145894.1 RIP metalloprotease RseP [Lachnospiraceae bacterium]
MIVTIIVFVLIFGVVVIAHELGHFLIAKLNGIKVLQFSIGMGPDIIKFTKGDTKYVLKLLPIGGACMFEGEDGIYSTDKDGDNHDGSKKAEKPEGAFSDANVWSRIATVFAGPFFNIILAFLLSLIVVGFSGEVIPTINSLTDGYPAIEAGLQEGDIITKMDGERIYLQGEVTFVSAFSKGEPMEIEYKRDGKKYTTTITPKYSETDGRYYLGFTIGEAVECKGLDLIKYSVYEVRYWLKTTVKSLLMLVQGRLSANDLSGPVGIAATIDETIEVAKPYGIPTVVLTMINFAVLLSVNLGVMNLLPLPALDGGRLLFLLIEVVRGKPVSPEKEGLVHFIGFVALMILMVFVLYNDIVRIFA